MAAKRFLDDSNQDKDKMTNGLDLQQHFLLLRM
jgi:hypothetical protein